MKVSKLFTAMFHKAASGTCSVPKGPRRGGKNRPVFQRRDEVRMGQAPKGRLNDWGARFQKLQPSLRDLDFFAMGPSVGIETLGCSSRMARMAGSLQDSSLGPGRTNCREVLGSKLPSGETVALDGLQEPGRTGLRLGGNGARFLVLLLIIPGAFFAPVRTAQAQLTFELLYQFDPANFGPANPTAGLTQGTDGNFYGTTEGGGANDAGTVFRITPNGALATLFSFNFTDVWHPYGGLVQASDGNFYGTASGGGNVDINGHYFGTVFKVMTNGVLTVLYSFSGTDGSRPTPGLVQGSDGNFYGTTVFGGLDFNGYGDTGNGTAFQITPGGVLTTLLYFEGLNGAFPHSGLVQGSDGNFYGTTYSGGPGYNNGDIYSGNGTVFKITTNGVLTTVFSFNGSDGRGPAAGLVEGSDGNFFGMTEAGGASRNCCSTYGCGCGTIFRISTNGVLTTLFSFDGTNGNYWPRTSAALVQGRDGIFYGATSFNFSPGVIFQITTSGVFTTLVTFNATNGSRPSGLVQGSDGNFYGTTIYGGAYGQGTVFRLAPPPPPVLTAIMPSSGAVTLTWTSFANAVYRVQYKPALAAADWLDLAPDVTATGSAASFTDNIGTATERYYRVALLP